MEIFVDGGLFELIIAITMGYIVNFIFLRKFLLILFSILVISVPILFIFIHRGELYYFLLVFSMLSSVLLVLVLWSIRKQRQGLPLFNLDQFRKKIFKRK